MASLPSSVPPMPWSGAARALAPSRPMCVCAAQRRLGSWDNTVSHRAFLSNNHSTKTRLCSFGRPFLNVLFFILATAPHSSERQPPHTAPRTRQNNNNEHASSEERSANMQQPRLGWVNIMSGKDVRGTNTGKE